MSKDQDKLWKELWDILASGNNHKGALKERFILIEKQNIVNCVECKCNINLNDTDSYGTVVGDSRGEYVCNDCFYKKCEYDR